MATEGEIYLGVTGDEDLISNYAKEVERSFEEIGRSGRTLGGVYKSDIRSRKYTFKIRFDYIDQTALNLIYTKYSSDAEMNLRMYITDTTYFTNFSSVVPVVRMVPFSSTDFMKNLSSKIYKNSHLTFLEV